MEAESSNENVEPPSLFWGLDPVFSACAKLYIKDILQMKESYQVPGIYMYNSHPIFQVDVLGTVVYKREREDFFCYGVDDSTGVINCLCWKNEKWREQPGETKSGGRLVGAAPGGFDVAQRLQEVCRAQRSGSALEIGDLLRVRGSLRSSRAQREIKASSFYKVSDPVMAAQISWMLQAPELYRKCYDKPFQLPSSELGATSNATEDPASFQTLVARATRTLKDFLREKEVNRFRPYDVEYLLHPLVPRPLTHGSSTEQEPGAAGAAGAAGEAGPAVPTHIRQLLKESLVLLQEEGVIFRKVLSQDEVYNVTEQDKDLLAVIRDVIREDSKREKYAEKGCHVLHVLSSVRQRYSRNLGRLALERALKHLEHNSDIISTTDCHYTVL